MGIQGVSSRLQVKVFGLVFLYNHLQFLVKRFLDFLSDSFEINTQTFVSTFSRNIYFKSKGTPLICMAKSSKGDPHISFTTACSC